MSDKDAQAILALNNLQSNKPIRTKPPIKLLIIAAILIILVVIASYIMSSFKPGTNPAPAGLGFPAQGNPSSGRGVSKQINQDVKSCSNPLNATLVC